MLKHTRKSGIPDTMRIAAAISRPGIDPRFWVSYAIVNAVGIDEEGVFIDVTTMPTLGQYTARLASSYAGPGYGSYVPVGINDEVLVEAPSGDPLEGLVVSGRLHSASDNIPEDVQNFPNDLVTVVKQGQSFRLGVSGGGKVYIGQTTAADAAVVGTTYRTAEDAYFGMLENLISFIVAFPALAVYFAPPIPPAAPTAQYLALQAWLAQVVLFHEASTTYLSQTVEIGK